MDKDKDEVEGGRYIHPPFVLLLSLPQKMSNLPSDLDKGIKSPKYFVCIPIIYHLRSTNFVLEFLGRGDSKAKKKFSTSRLKERLKSHSAFTTSTAFNIINDCCLIREHLEFHLLSNHRQDLETQLYANQ